MSFLNHVIEFVEVISTGLSGPSSAVTANLTGIAGFAVDADGKVTGEDASDEAAEGAHEQDIFQSLGIVGRPLPRDGAGKVEALAFRTQDGLLPFAFRDLRLTASLGGSAPREGQLLFMGYGGAFLSHAMTAGNVGSKRGNISTWYVPGDFAGDGTPQKAHAISIDPTPGNSSISITHASGLFVILTEDAGGGSPGILASVDGATFMRMSPGELTLQATKILLKGNVYVGRQAEAGAPLLAGPTSPPCPSLYVSPV